MRNNSLYPLSKWYISRFPHNLHQNIPSFTEFKVVPVNKESFPRIVKLMNSKDSEIVLEATIITTCITRHTYQSHLLLTLYMKVTVSVRIMPLSINSSVRQHLPRSKPIWNAVGYKTMIAT